ncbi:MAG: sulfate reduction electron transfer complex DsrMKJOP subunit DsrM [Desulfobacterales bacterium]
MNKRYLFAFLVVLVLFLVAALGSAVGLQWLFGVVIPYAAVIVFVVGFARKVLNWAASPVPFAIPTTGGQGRSFDWIPQAKIDNPSSGRGVFLRMLFEVLTFRSLFRNTRMRLKEEKIAYQLEIFLWVGALAFHYAFLTVLLRHTRFFLEPTPGCIQVLETLDSFFRVEILYPGIQFGLPAVYLSGFVLLLAVIYLTLRRILIPAVRYVSLASDYFPLLLIFGIALSGILMRYVTKVDIRAVKELTLGLVTFRPTVPEGIGAVFYIHLFLVSALIAYFPYSKLMHLGGIFLSPTRNLRGDTRAYRHVNPWNYPVPVHTYEEYEEEFREKMIEAGLPVEKGLADAAEEAAQEKE